MKLVALLLGLCAMFSYTGEKITGKYEFKTGRTYNMMELRADFTYETHYSSHVGWYNTVYGVYHIEKDTLILKTTHQGILDQTWECFTEKYLVAGDSLKTIWYDGDYRIDCSGGPCGSPKVEDKPRFCYIRMH